MKKFFVMLMAVMMLAACGNRSAKTSDPVATPDSTEVTVDSTVVTSDSVVVAVDSTVVAVDSVVVDTVAAE